MLCEQYIFLIPDGDRVHDALKTKIKHKHVNSVNASRGSTKIQNFGEHLNVSHFPLMGRLYYFGGRVSVRVSNGISRFLCLVVVSMGPWMSNERRPEEKCHKYGDQRKYISLQSSPEAFTFKIKIIQSAESRSGFFSYCGINTRITH